jgi:hypothetical protein
MSLSLCICKVACEFQNFQDVGLVAINMQQPLTIAAAAAGVAPTMCTHPRCQRLAATIVEEEMELAATFVKEKLELWHHFCL